MQSSNLLSSREDFLTTDGHGLTRIFWVLPSSVLIRVHPWLNSSWLRLRCSVLQSSNLLAGCEDFSDSPGERPSSGAASQEVRTGADKCDGLRGSGVAAPEDGRSPLRLRLRCSVILRV